jgi:O-antigen/teichoic acid export membrane protein
MVGQPLLLNALSIPATAYIIHELGEFRFGEWSTAAALVAVMGCIASFGVRSLFVRSIAQNPDHAETALGEQLGLRGVLSLLAGGVALLVAMLLGYDGVILGCVAIAAFSLIVSTLASALGDVLQGFQRFKAFASVNLASGLLLTAGSVLAVVLGYGPLGLMAAYALGPLSSLGLFYLLLRRDSCRPKFLWDFPKYKALLWEARMVGAQGVIGSIQAKIESLVVPKLVGIAEMGYFSAGLMIASRLEMVPDGIATAFFPMVSKDAAKGRDSASRNVLHLLVVSLAACLALVLLGMFIARPLADYFIKEGDPGICTLVMWITVWSLPLNALYYPMYTSLTACGRHTEASRRVIHSMFASTVVSLVMIYFFGLVGASWSWVIRQGIHVGFLAPGFLRAFPAVAPQVPLSRLLASGAGMAGVLWFFDTLSMPVLLRLVLGGGLGLAVYVGMLALLKVIDLPELSALLRRR